VETGGGRLRPALYGAGALGASLLLQTIILWIVYFYAPPAGQGAARLSPTLVGLALASLNGMQVPASAVIGLVPLRLLARPSTSYAVAAAILAALAILLVLPGMPLVLAAGVFGFCAAYILVLSFALPGLLAPPAEVARLSAGTFAISYTTAFLVTLVTGAVWDVTRVEASAFLPAVGGAVVLAALGPRLVSAAVSASR